MTLPPLYKYLSVSGAKLTLGNGKFKYAKPSDFNDLEDLTIQSIFPEEIEEALKRLEAGFTDVIMRNLNEEPTCSSPMKEQLQFIQQAYRKNPDAAEAYRAAQAESDDSVYDVEYHRKSAQTYIAVINELMQDFRVLCVTTDKDSERMWSEYSENHKGIALRIQPNLAKDSIFQRFRPVSYREKRPPLYEDTLEFCAGALFGDLEARTRECIERIIYTKTLEWQHEGEYRLAIPILDGEKPWDTLAYHRNEITELYLGVDMEESDIEEIIGMARAINHDIAIFRATRNRRRILVFNKY